MANPWDNDPIVKPAVSGINPWDNDPIVSSAIVGTELPKQEDVSGTEARYPRFTQAKEEGKNYLQTSFALGNDLASSLGRTIAASPELRNGVQAYLNSQAKTSSDSDNGVVRFLENVVRDPATAITGGMSAPIKQAGKEGIKAVLSRLGRMTLQGLKEGAVSAAIHQSENYAMNDQVDVGAAAAETAFSGVFASVFGTAGEALSALKQGSSTTAKTIISRFTDIPEDALERAAKPGELDRIAQAVQASGGDLEKLGEETFEMIGKLRVKAQDELDAGIMAARPAAGVTRPADVSALATGESIEGAARTAKEAIGDRFQQNQDNILTSSGTGARELPANRGVDFPYKSQNPIQDEIDNIFYEVGYDPARGFTGKESLNNRAIGSGAFTVLEKAKEMVGRADNTREALNMRRQIQKSIAFGGPEGKPLFGKGSDEDLLMQRLYAKVNDTVEQQLRAQAKDKGIPEDVLAELWKANNAEWKVGHDALGLIDDKLRIGKTSPEDYVGSIKKLGVDGLKKVSELAKTDKNFKEVWSEIQNGFFDNLVRKSMDVDGNIDVRKMQKNMASIDKDLLASVLPKKTIRTINSAIENVKKFGSESPDEIGGTITGKGKSSTAINTQDKLKNIGSQAKQYQQALKDLVFLEDALNVPKDRRMSTIAQDIYSGKQLRMTDKGKLPKMSDIKTGKFWAGMGMGSSIGGSVGAAVAGPVGMAAGSAAGTVAGIAAQSPAGAVAMYKALNKMDDVLSSKAARRIESGAKITNRVFTGPEFRAALRTNFFQPEGD